MLPAISFESLPIVSQGWSFNFIFIGGGGSPKLQDGKLGGLGIDFWLLVTLDCSWMKMKLKGRHFEKIEEIQK